MPAPDSHGTDRCSHGAGRRRAGASRPRSRAGSGRPRTTDARSAVGRSSGSGLELLLTSDDVDSLRDTGVQQLEHQIRSLGIADNELIGRNVEIGPPHKVLADTAWRIGADLLVVGASEPNGSHPRLLGSTADRVLRCAPCPILILKGGSTLRVRRVLAPVDLSPCSACALRSGLGFLSQLGKRRGVEVETRFVLSALHRQLASQFSPRQIDQFALEELARFTRDNSMEWKGWVRSRIRIGDPRARASS